MLAIAAGYAVAGGIFGETGWLWGAVGGLVAATVIRWVGICRDRICEGLIVVSSIAGMSIFESAVSARSGQIDLSLSLRSSSGLLLMGAAFGYALWRPGRLRLSAIGTSAVGWALGGVAALMFGTGIGYLEELRSSEVEAGELQAIGTDFFIWAGMLIGVIGAGIVLSLFISNPSLAAAAGTGVFTLFAMGKIGFSFIELASRAGDLFAFLPEFWPPVWEWPRTVGGTSANQIIDPMIETLQIAVIGATIGCAIALPVAFLASRPTSLNLPTFWVNRTFMNVVRTVPDVFWAALFAASVGFNPFAGALAMVMFSIAIMAKLFSETVDAIDLGPLEAARASGARHSQMVQYSAMPQVLPNYVAYALYIFELNIRASVVIGLVGAGGIGRLLEEQRSLFQWDRVFAIVIVIFAAVILIEIVSVYVRRRIV